MKNEELFSEEELNIDFATCAFMLEGMKYDEAHKNAVNEYKEYRSYKKEVSDMTEKSVKVVRYNDNLYVWYKTNTSGKAQLINGEGNKFSGTPNPDKLTFVRSIPCKEFNNHHYFMTAIGCFSATTGRKIVNTDILNIFKNEDQNKIR